MNKIETLKAEKDGLEVLPDILRYAREGVPVDEIPPDQLERMKWYGVFHRAQQPGTFMLRLRIPGGKLSSEQLHVIAGITNDFGRGTVDVTTRQNIQMRWLTLDVLPEVWRRLESVGLESRQTGLDNVRNFIGCPLAGIDGEEVLDTTAILDQLGGVYLGKREYSNLPRKFNVSVAGCREDCGHAQTQDLGLVPASKTIGTERLIGFNVLVGGSQGGTTPRLATPLDAFVLPDEVAPLFSAILRVFREHGAREVRTKARLKWLIIEHGEEWLRARIEEELGRPLERAGSDERTTVAGDHIGVRQQRQAGLHYVGLHVPVGRMTGDQLSELARIAECYGSGEVRLTVGQNAVIPNVSADKISALLGEPLLETLQHDPGPAWRNLVACTGNDYCHYSLIDTKARAIELATELDRRQADVPDGTRIHVSGCVHACGKHHIADIGLQGQNLRTSEGVVEAVDVFSGGRLGENGRLGERVAKKVAIPELADAVEQLITGLAPVPAMAGQHRG